MEPLDLRVNKRSESPIPVPPPQPPIGGDAEPSWGSTGGINPIPRPLPVGPLASEFGEESSSRTAETRKILSEAVQRAGSGGLTAREAAVILVQALTVANIALIAADFDLTVTTRHTGGATENNKRNPLLTSLSSDFDEFAHAAQESGIAIGVVTFSDEKYSSRKPKLVAGDSLVRRVLQLNNANFTVKSIVAKHPSFYKSPRDYLGLGLTEPMADNKSYHYRTLCSQLNMSPNQGILVDDDIKNCIAHSEAGGLSIHVGGTKGFDFKNLRVI